MTQPITLEADPLTLPAFTLGKRRICTSLHMLNSTALYFLVLSIQNSVEPKNMAIPGYAGFVPGIKADNIHAKGFSNMTKQSFNN